MSLGPMELVLILGIALLLFGPSRLPGLGKSMGDAIRGFKKGIDGEDETPREVEKLTDSTTTNPQPQKTKEKSEV